MKSNQKLSPSSSSTRPPKTITNPASPKATMMIPLGKEDVNREDDCVCMYADAVVDDAALCVLAT